MFLSYEQFKICFVISEAFQKCTSIKITFYTNIYLFLPGKRMITRKLVVTADVHLFNSLYTRKTKKFDLPSEILVRVIENI